MSLAIIIILLVLTTILACIDVLFRPRKSFFNLDVMRTSQSLPDLSIIICAKNEYDNLQRHLSFILNQNYPSNWEVIVVDDDSTDESLRYLNELKNQFPHLIIVQSAANAKKLPGKKNALQLGIKAAKYNCLLLTDADCKPASKDWAALMATALQSNSIKIVAGFGNYAFQRGVINKYIRFQTLQTLILYSGMAAIGLPYMGVGRNLLYQKELWQYLENDPVFWDTYSQTLGGDDDLFIAKVATKANFRVQLCPQAHTISVPKSTWPDWWRQRQRHVDAGKLYPTKINTLLACYGLSNGVFWLISFLGFWLIPMQCTYLFLIFISTLLVRWYVYLFYNYQWRKKLGISEKWYNIILLNLLDSVMQLITMIFASSKKKSQWK